MKRLIRRVPPPKEMPEKGILYVRGVKEELIGFVTEEAATMGYDSLGDYLNVLFEQLRERCNKDAS
jgi:hypothetical protein